MSEHISKVHKCIGYQRKHGGNGEIQQIYDDKGRKLVEGKTVICGHCNEEYKIEFNKKI